MTTLTANGVSTTKKLGSENYEIFTSYIGHRKVKIVQYDYRHTNGNLFTCVKPTLSECRAARDFALRNDLI